MTAKNIPVIPSGHSPETPKSSKVEKIVRPVETTLTEPIAPAEMRESEPITLLPHEAVHWSLPLGAIGFRGYCIKCADDFGLLEHYVFNVDRTAIIIFLANDSSCHSRDVKILW